MPKLTLIELKALLDTVDPSVKVFNMKVLEPSNANNVPYIVYQVISQSTKLNADNASVWKVDSFQVSLYQQKKDESLESKLETVLNNSAIIFEMVLEDFDTSSNVHRRIYEFELDRF